jgi:hypothetical protein
MVFGGLTMIHPRAEPRFPSLNVGPAPAGPHVSGIGSSARELRLAVWVPSPRMTTRVRAWGRAVTGAARTTVVRRTVRRTEPQSSWTARPASPAGRACPTGRASRRHRRPPASRHFDERGCAGPGHAGPVTCGRRAMGRVARGRPYARGRGRRGAGRRRPAARIARGAGHACSGAAHAPATPRGDCPAKLRARCSSLSVAPRKTPRISAISPYRSPWMSLSTRTVRCRAERTARLSSTSPAIPAGSNVSSGAGLAADLVDMPAHASLAPVVAVRADRHAVKPGHETDPGHG